MARARSCLDDDEICELLSGGARDVSELVAHLDRCDACRRLVASVLRTDRGDPALPKASVALPRGSSSALPVAAPTTPRRSWLTRGAVVAERFVLHGWIGGGASGTVWSARELATERLVALKILKVMDPGTIRRLVREARLLAPIAHPNIVRVHDVIEDAALGPVVVMELLEGATLEDHLLAQGPRDLAHVAPMVVAILSALHAAHARGVIHRDLKPQNVFLCTTDEVKVLDFGLAKLTGAGAVVDTPWLTTSGVVVGTPAYMAPEQIFADANIDERADIYAVGAIVIRSMTGKPPLDAGSLGEVMKAHATATPIAFDAPVPEEIRALVLKMVARDRTQRPASVELPLRVFASYAKTRTG